MQRLLLHGALLSVALAGCDRGPARYNVAGKVTFLGQPVPAGMIYFDADVTRNNNGAQGFAFIKDGAYNTAAQGKGSGGGPVVVRIQGYDGKSGNDLPYGQPLFPDFRKEVELPRASTTMDFDVKRE